MEAGAITARTLLVALLATWPRRIGLGLVLLIPVIVVLLGGVRPAPPVSHEVAVGATVDTGTLLLTPSAFFVTDEAARDTLEYTEGAVAWLGVLVTVENQTDEAIPLNFPGAASDALVPDVAEEQFVTGLSGTPDTALRIADASDGSTSLPGVTSEVAVMWPIGDPEAIGDTLTFSMTESIWTFRLLSGEDGWLSIGDVWTMELPRTELPDSLYEPEEDV